MDETDSRAVLERAFEHAVRHLQELDRAPVVATASADELRERLSRPLSQEGTDPVQVIDELVADMSGGVIGSASGRFFSWVVGGSVPSALASDWLVSSWDQNAALHACGPGVAIAEEVSGAWLKELLGLPLSASFALVTGTQMAHVTCLCAARNSLLGSRGWDVERQGMRSSPEIKVLVGRDRHGSVDRAARFLGFGQDSLIPLEVDRGKVLASSLERVLNESKEELKLVVLQAGEINTGVFDPFEELIPMAHEAGAWVHIDGAFGLWANASPKYCGLLEGAASADSWTTDGHKWLNVPYDCGYAFTAHPEPHRQSMAQRASYLIHQETSRDSMDWNPEWSRRARGVATYAAIRELGREGVAGLVERCCQYARQLVLGIGSLPGAEVVAEPLINQGLVRFLDPRTDATEEDHGRRTDEIVAAITRTGEAFFGATTWESKRCMRVSVCNWRTTEQDVERAVAAARSVLQG